MEMGLGWSGNDCSRRSLKKISKEEGKRNEGYKKILEKRFIWESNKYFVFGLFVAGGG